MCDAGTIFLLHIETPTRDGSEFQHLAPMPDILANQKHTKGIFL
jgi:hypothetical protein